MTSAVHSRPVIHGERSLPVRGAVEQPVDVVGSLQFDTIDRQDIVTDIHVRAGRRQRRTQFRIPTFVVVNTRHFVAAIFNRKIRAQEASGRLRHIRHVAAPHI